MSASGLDELVSSVTDAAERVKLQLELDKFRWDRSFWKTVLTGGPTILISSIALVFSVVQWRANENHLTAEQDAAEQRALSAKLAADLEWDFECVRFIVERNEVFETGSAGKIGSLLDVMGELCGNVAPKLLPAAQQAIVINTALSADERYDATSKAGGLVTALREAAPSAVPSVADRPGAPVDAAPTAPSPAPKTSSPLPPAPPAPVPSPSPAPSAIAGEIRPRGEFRVFFHYAEPANAEKIDAMIAALRSAGYRVPGKERIAKIDRSEVRIYRPAQVAQGADVEALINDAVGAKVFASEPKDISKTFPNLPDGVMEVWLAGRPT